MSNQTIWQSYRLEFHGMDPLMPIVQYFLVLARSWDWSDCAIDKPKAVCQCRPLCSYSISLGLKFFRA